MAGQVDRNDEAEEEATVPRRVLVVEDNRDLANLMSRWVREHFGPSTEVHVAHSVEEGEEAIERVPVLDIVLLDRHFPEGTGDELLDALHVHFDPIVVMTTGVEPSSRLIRLPVADYLIKPIERESLLKRLSLLEKLEASGVLDSYANARKATLLEFHLDSPAEDPLYRRFAARWDYDRLEVAVGDAGAFVYELYTGREGERREGHVEISVVGRLEQGLEDLVEAGDLVAVGELVPSGGELAWIDVNRAVYTEPPSGGYTIYEFGVETPETLLDRSDSPNGNTVEQELEAAFR